jgi:fumarate hydratase class II
MGNSSKEDDGQRSQAEGRRLQLGFVTEAEFDRVVDPAKMVKPHVATAR